MCKVLLVSHSTYRKYINHEPSNRDKFNTKLDTDIKRIYLESKGLYGSPKILDKLLKIGYKVSLKLVQRRMRILGLKSRIIKKYKPKTSECNVSCKKNTLNQEFNVTKINKVFCTDITYINTIKDGWTYLAETIDLCSRKIVGYSYDKNMTSDLAINALKNAITNIKDTTGIIVQTDLGCQYTSTPFESFLLKNHMLHSYSHKGYPYDNSPIESFHATLKKEEVTPDNIYKSFDEAKVKLFEYIEGWYNNKRTHSSIGYRTPNEVYYEQLAA